MDTTTERTTTSLFALTAADLAKVSCERADLTIVGLSVISQNGDTMEVEAPSVTARVAIYVGDFRLEGDLHVGTEIGGRQRRVSDALNGETPFIVLTDVTMAEMDFIADDADRYETIIIRKGEIKFAIPLE